MRIQANIYRKYVEIKRNLKDFNKRESNKKTKINGLSIFLKNRQIHTRSHYKQTQNGWFKKCSLGQMFPMFFFGI